MKSEPIRVLLVEDDPRAVKLLRITLADKMLVDLELIAVETLNAALQQLDKEEFDLILLDLSLPDTWGLDTVLAVNRHASDTPIVVLTGNDDERLALEAVRLGAQDYLVKAEVTSTLLFRTIRHAIERHHLIKDLEKQITALLHSEVRFHKMIEHNADAIIIVDQRGIVQFANPAAETLFGHQADDLIGKEFGHEIIIGKTTEIEVLDFDRQQPLATAEMRVVELVWEGKPAYLATLRDITERKRVEQDLHQHMLEIEARNEELDAFAHTAAHDLRNPLTLIVGYAKMLEEEYPRLQAQDIQTTLHTIANTGQKMSNIIDGLLLLAGLRKQNVDFEALNMALIVNEAKRHLTHLIETRKPEIITPDTWPVAKGYGPWVEQVWTNYISNGIKYGGQPPRLELGAATQPDGMIRFWIRDNGPGLTPEEQSKLFVPFTRLGNRNNAKGYGLGLSIVRRIVEKLGGQVGVRNIDYGQGSEFFFTLLANS